MQLGKELKHFLICICVLFCMVSVGYSSIGYTISLDHPTYRDDALIPLAFCGGGLGLGMIADYGFHPWIISATTDLGMSYAENRFGHGAVLFRLWGQFDFQHQVYASQKLGNFYMGIPLYIHLNDWYLFSWDDAHLYWHTVYWTGFSAKHQKELLPKWFINTSIALPIYAFVSSSDQMHYNKQDALTHIGFWFSKPHENLEGVALNQYQGLELSMGLKHPRSRSLVHILATYSYSNIDYLTRSQMGLFRLQWIQQWGSTP